jgi:hypothetical protein
LESCWKVQNSHKHSNEICIPCNSLNSLDYLVITIINSLSLPRICTIFTSLRATRPGYESEQIKNGCTMDTVPFFFFNVNHSYVADSFITQRLDLRHNLVIELKPGFVPVEWSASEIVYILADQHTQHRKLALHNDRGTHLHLCAVKRPAVRRCYCHTHHWQPFSELQRSLRNGSYPDSLGKRLRVLISCVPWTRHHRQTEAKRSVAQAGALAARYTVWHPGDCCTESKDTYDKR